MLYDPAHRLVLSQDGNQKQKNEWTFYLYDALGRLAVQGLCVNPESNLLTGAIVKVSYTGSGSYGGYDLAVSFCSSVTLLKVNLYDAYGFANQKWNWVLLAWKDMKMLIRATPRLLVMDY